MNLATGWPVTVRALDAEENSLHRRTESRNRRHLHHVRTVECRKFQRENHDFDLWKRFCARRHDGRVEDRAGPAAEQLRIRNLGERQHRERLRLAHVRRCADRNDERRNPHRSRRDGIRRSKRQSVGPRHGRVALSRPERGDGGVGTIFTGILSAPRRIRTFENM